MGIYLYIFYIQQSLSVPLSAKLYRGGTKRCYTSSSGKASKGARDPWSLKAGAEANARRRPERLFMDSVEASALHKFHAVSWSKKIPRAYKV